jgi:hypothetical protein
MQNARIGEMIESVTERRCRLLVAAIGTCVVVGCGGPETDAGRDPVQTPPPPSREELAAKTAALASLEPTAVAPPDRAAYFDALTHVTASRRNGEHPEAGSPDEPDPDVVRKVLALSQVVGTSDARLASRIREWLYDRVSDFLQAYAYETAKVLASPPTSRWRQSEAAWGSWAMAQLPTMTEQEAGKLNYGVSAYVPDGVKAFPTLDRFSVGLSIADLWVRAGHPEVDRNRSAFENVVCAVHNDYGKLSAYCGGGRAWWYREALSSDVLTHRLAAAVVARHDPPLTTAVTLGIGTSPKTLAVLTDFEQDAGVWRDALLAISRVDDLHWLQDWLVPDLRRIWKSRVSWRGVVLYALAEASGKYADEQHEQHGVVDWAHFSRNFEGGVNRADFATFLDQSPRSLELARWVMPVRTKGWSVVDVVLPRLDGYFALPHDVPAGAPPGPGFDSVVAYLCYRDHDMMGLAKLRAYFAKRAPAHPGDPLNTLMDHYTTKDCRGRG